MGEMLKITVDKAGITRVWRDGVEINHVQKVCFTAEPGTAPVLDVKTVILKEKDDAKDITIELSESIGRAIMGVR